VEVLKMIELHPRYVVDERGQPVAVQLDLPEYEKLLEDLKGWQEWAADMGGLDPYEGHELRPDFVQEPLERDRAFREGREEFIGLAEAKRRLGS
jgi:hypothetical protein